MANSTQITYSAGYSPLPDTPGKLSWSIPPTTFRKGRGYSFNLGAQNIFCPTARQTTWSHDPSDVNGGPTACTQGPRPEPNGQPVQRRMWHQDGLNDWSCTPSGFDSSMPTGWLMVQSGSGSGYVRRGVRFSSPPSDENLCGTTAAKAGATSVLWRDSPNPPPGPAEYHDYVCIWPQYGPLRSTTSAEHGWYYGIPWGNDGNGSPRDSYIRLETIDYGTLLEQYTPQLRYHIAEPYR